MWIKSNELFTVRKLLSAWEFFPAFGVRVSILLKIGSIDSSFGWDWLPISSFFSFILFSPFMLFFLSPPHLDLPSYSYIVDILFLPSFKFRSSAILASEMVCIVLVLQSTRVLPSLCRLPCLAVLLIVLWLESRLGLDDEIGKAMFGGGHGFVHV